jgi:hypothetical protein
LANQTKIESLQESGGTSLVLGFVLWLVGGFKVRQGVQRLAPRSVTVRWDLKSAVWSVFVLLFFGSIMMLVFGPVRGLVFALVLGLVFGLGFGLMFELMVVWRTPLAATAAATPRLVYQKDVQSQLLSGFVLGIVFGVGMGLIGLVGGLGFGLVGPLGFGLVCGLAVGLVVLFWGGAASSLLLFTETALLLQGQRVRFMPLLENALAKQVLRQAGAVYQFRHADLQDRLADQYQARPTRHRAARQPRSSQPPP